MTIAYKALKKSLPIGVFSATLLVALTNQPSSAFTINPPGPIGALNKSVPQEPYTLGGQNWKVDLNPINVTSIDAAGKTAFKTYLDKSIFGGLGPVEPFGWTFNLAPKDLAGSFDILNYVACAPQTTCKSNLGWPQKHGVGAFIDIEYKPGTGDPALGFDPTTLNGIHWIQRVVNNHKSGDGGGHGVDDDKIDVDPGQTNPYYDQPGPLGGQPTADMSKGLFADRPYRFDPDAEHKFSFDLFLVQQTAPKTVTIYNGVKWGWKNVPEPLTLIASGLAIGFGALCQREYSKKRQQK